MERVLAGDRSPFHAIVDRHARPLLSALARGAADPEEVREVYQETWVRALERLEELRDPSRLRSWLLSIAFNLQRQRLRRPRPEGLDEARVPEAPPELDRVERDELRARVGEEVARLPEGQRRVVELRLQQELSHAEIAGLLGITPENARAHLYQGLRRLRERLRDLGPLTDDDGPR